MTVVSFANLKTPEAEAETRQEVVRCLHETIMHSADGLKNLPVFVEEAFEFRVWEHERVFAGGTRQGPISFDAFVTEPYPVGLGTKMDVIKTLLTEAEKAGAQKGAAERAINLLDGLLQRKPGEGQARDAETGRMLPNVDNIHVRDDRPSGTSAAAGLRRLRKAAEDKIDQETGQIQPGDDRAKELLDEVLSGEMSVNKACVEMGWRPRTTTIRVEATDSRRPSIDSEVKRDAAKMLASRLAERFPAAEWDWLKSTLYTAGAKLVADAFVNETGAGSAVMDRRFS